MRKGDTLIEVAIAIAIFSLVAIGVVSVVNGSTSATQSALEVTITREEIDAQAEAIRFIHNSYIAGGQANIAGNTRYKTIWEKITKQAKDNESIINQILAYNPASCAEVYNNRTLFNQGAFIINTHMLGNGTANDIVITPQASNNDGIFKPASTYPRLIYAGQKDNQLLDDGSYNTLYRVEGIYVVAVKDQSTTTIVDTNGTPQRGESAFYDFYIRTCWFTPGADHPSTISTVIRLQDPTIVSY